MRRKVSFIVAFALIFCLCSCKKRKVELPDLFSGGFECEISFSLEGIAYRAYILRDVSCGKRVRIEFLEPIALCGITVEKNGEDTSVTLDGISFGDSGAIGWLQLEGLFDLNGRVVSSVLDDSSGEEADRLTLIREAGDRYEIYIARNGDPIRICATALGRYIDARILKFGRI